MTEWDGKDRRAPEGVIIAVMNHVQETLDKHTVKMDEKFSHVNSRLDNLMQSINSYMAKQEDIEVAFLKTKDGKPDYHGHFYDHDHRKQVAEWWGTVKDKAIVKLAEWVAVGVAGWIMYTLWEAFLKGPPK